MEPSTRLSARRSERKPLLNVGSGPGHPRLPTEGGSRHRCWCSGGAAAGRGALCRARPRRLVRPRSRCRLVDLHRRRCRVRVRGRRHGVDRARDGGGGRGECGWVPGVLYGNSEGQSIESSPPAARSTAARCDGCSLDYSAKPGQDNLRHGSNQSPPVGLSACPGYGRSSGSVSVGSWVVRLWRSGARSAQRGYRRRTGPFSTTPREPPRQSEDISVPARPGSRLHSKRPPPAASRRGPHVDRRAGANQRAILRVRRVLPRARCSPRATRTLWAWPCG